MFKKISTLSLAIALILVMTAQFANAQSNWAAFWTKFKTAVAKGDKQAVLNLSESANLPQGYQSLFGTKSKKQCFAKAKAVKDEQGGYSVFCGEQGYYFEKINGQFKFKEAFANDQLKGKK